MARRSRSRSQAPSLQRSDVVAVRLPVRPRLTALQALEDRRRWHPERAFRPALSFREKRPRIVARDVRRSNQWTDRTLPSRLHFALPKSVAICIRRKERREVIFAKRKAGKGSRARRRLRNWFSNIICKR